MRTFALTLALLALAGGPARTEDVDPEPPGGPLGQLRGKWTSTKTISSGKERPFTTTSYHFEKGKVTCRYGPKSLTTQVRTFEIDHKRRAILMTYDGVTRRHFFKFQDGELRMIIDRSKDPNADPDFSGKTVNVMVLKKEK